MVHAASNPTPTLQRFIDAQRDIYALALEELREGEKRSHWMWFVLPQLRGLGHSDMARHYGLVDAEEARAYLAHPLLGARLLECMRALLRHRTLGAEAILGDIDAMKLRSCLTLFRAVAPQVPEFAQALQQFYAGVPDPRTLRMLAGGAP